MKYFISILLILAMVKVYGQQDIAFNDFSALTSMENIPESYSQKLYILRKNGKTIKVSYYYMYKIETSREWYDLIQSFQTDLHKVVSNLPPYRQFEMKYVENDQLVVKEIKDKETFILSDSNENEPLKINYATLWGKQVVIQLEAENYGELLDTVLIEEMKEAISKVKSKAAFDFSLTKTKLYNVETSTMTKDPGRQGEIEYVMGANLGFLGRNPSATVYGTVGVSLNLKSYVYGRIEEILTTGPDENYTMLLGVGAGIKIRFRMKRGDKDWMYGGEIIYQPSAYDPNTSKIRLAAFLGHSNKQTFRVSIGMGNGETTDLLGLDFIATPSFSMVTRF